MTQAEMEHQALENVGRIASLLDVIRLDINQGRWEEAAGQLDNLSAIAANACDAAWTVAVQKEKEAGAL